MEIYNEDCVKGSLAHLEDESIDLMICDPPFGIKEKNFSRHYNRNPDKVIEGYTESIGSYFSFSSLWLEQAMRVLKPNGTIYVVSGWNNLGALLSAIEKIGFFTINHIIWKYKFGVFATTKFISSHYHILYLKKNAKAKPFFNTHCRFGCMETDENGSSLLNKDLEDVWVINKEYKPHKDKNLNKLPDELIEKMILYSSKEKDKVCDFFLGNFTTANVAKQYNRIPVGFEINKNAFDYFLPKLEEIEAGCKISQLRKVPDDKPINQGKKITPEEKRLILADFVSMHSMHTKKECLTMLGKKYGRGKFSIINLLKTSTRCGY